MTTRGRESCCYKVKVRGRRSKGGKAERVPETGRQAKEFFENDYEI